MYACVILRRDALTLMSTHCVFSHLVVGSPLVCVDCTTHSYDSIDIWLHRNRFYQQFKCAHVKWSLSIYWVADYPCFQHLLHSHHSLFWKRKRQRETIVLMNENLCFVYLRVVIKLIVYTFTRLLMLLLLLCVDINVHSCRQIFGDTLFQFVFFFRIISRLFWHPQRAFSDE